MTGQRSPFQVRFSAVVMAVLAGWCWSAQGQFAPAPDPSVTLGDPVPTNGQIRFELNGRSNVTYAILFSPDLLNWSTVASGTNLSLITVAAPASHGFYEAVQVPLLEYAVAARGDINMNGHGLVIDSFNSADTNFSTGGRYDPAKASTNGNVASVSGIVNIGLLTIRGNLYLGPTASYASGTNQVSGTIYTNCNIQFPDVVLPLAAWQPAPVIDGTNTFVSGGNYLVTNSNPIRVAATVHAVLHVTATTFQPSSITLEGVTNSGTLVIYQDSGNATLTANASGGPIASRAQDFIYLGLPGVTSITLGGLSNMTAAAIYAPEATLTANYGGATGINFSGSCIVGSFVLNGHFYLHYDESLASWPVQ